MDNVAVLTPEKSNLKFIPRNTLLEELYTHYSLSQLQTMLTSEPDQLLLKTWNVTSEKMFADIKVAIDFVKND